MGGLQIVSNNLQQNERQSGASDQQGLGSGAMTSPACSPLCTQSARAVDDVLSQPAFPLALELLTNPSRFVFMQIFKTMNLDRDAVNELYDIFAEMDMDHDGEVQLTDFLMFFNIGETRGAIQPIPQSSVLMTLAPSPPCARAWRIHRANVCSHGHEQERRNRLFGVRRFYVELLYFIFPLSPMPRF